MTLTKGTTIALLLNLLGLSAVLCWCLSCPWVKIRYLHAFLALFLFRYVRVIISIYGNAKYRATPIPDNPSYDASNVTVVIATAGILSDNLHSVVHSILRHPIRKFVLATAGNAAKGQRESFQVLFKDPRIDFIHCDEVNRRKQIALAMEKVKTSLVLIQDDRTSWPARPTLLPSLLAPFEDPKTGAVTASIDARNHNHLISCVGFWNFIGMNYLSRAYEEMRGTFTVEGAIITLAGRFGIFRSSIYGSPRFLKQYLNEYIFFGRVGPLNADDDKFHTRWLVNHGWKIKLQAGPEHTLMTELGVWPKYHEQALRWMRTTWRSNPRQLLNWRSWVENPYTTYYLFLWFFRFSFFHELGMFYCLREALKEAGKPEYFGPAAGLLLCWIVGLRLFRVWPQIRKSPKMIVYFPAYLVFVYYCSLLKVWALLTCWDAGWEVTGVEDKKED